MVVDISAHAVHTNKTLKKKNRWLKFIQKQRKT